MVVEGCKSRICIPDIFKSKSNPKKISISKVLEIFKVSQIFLPLLKPKEKKKKKKTKQRSGISQF